MKQQQFEKLVDDTLVKCHEHLLKGSEYADGDDFLGNFKRGAHLTGCTPLQVAFIQAAQHYEAVASFVRDVARGDTRDSAESIDGRIDGLISHCLLMKGLATEIKEEDPRAKARISEQRLAARTSAIQRQAEVVPVPTEPELRAER